MKYRKTFRQALNEVGTDPTQDPGGKTFDGLIDESYDEIMDHFSTTKSNVARYILNLQERGWVAKEMYKARTLKIL